MKKSLIALGIILLCIIIIAVGCSEQIKFWYDQTIVGDINTVWINEENNVWFVMDNTTQSYYGQVFIEGTSYYFEIGCLHGTMCLYFYEKIGSDKIVYLVNTHSQYINGQIVLDVGYSDFSQLPKGTKLVFKPYPRQAEHYLPK